MVCTTFAIESMADLLVWPTGCDYYFYLKIIIGLFVILVWGLYSVEKKVKPDADLLSAAGVISIAMLIITLIGTLVKNTENIPMIQSDILLYVLAFTIPIIVIWFWKD